MRGRGARLLCALALAVPIPLFAALGLSLPLPATVERLAAKLVPFAPSEPSDTVARVRGTIILAPGERQSGTSDTTTAAHLGTRRARAGESQDQQAAAAVHPAPAVGPIRTGDEAAREPTADSPKPAAEQVAAATPSPTAAPNPNPPSSDGGGTPTGGATEPVPPPPPAPVVETATNTVNGAVETVTNTAATATDPVVGTAKDAVPGGITRP